MTMQCSCPVCGQACSVPEVLLDKTVICPDCRGRFRIRGGTPFSTGADDEEFEIGRMVRALPSTPQGLRAARADSAGHGLGTAALFLGVLAFATSWIPCLGLIGIPIAGLGLLLGVFALIVALLGNGSGLKLAIGGCVFCVAAVAVVMSWLLPNGRLARPFARPNRIHVLPDERESLVTVNALQLMGEYRFNEAIADQKYLGKTLRVRGFVESTGVDRNQKKFAMFSANPRLGGVQCFFDDPFEDPTGQLAPGRFVTIQGRCEGKSGNVILRECEIQQFR